MSYYEKGINKNKNWRFIGVYVAFYQNESEEKNYNIRWGIKRSFESIDSKYQNRVCYGYCHDNCGKLIIESVEARVVHKIFGCNPVIITKEKYNDVKMEKLRRKSSKSKINYR